MAAKFDVLIDLVDRFTAPFARINRSISAANRPLTRLGTSMGMLGRQSGLSGIAKAAGGAASSLGALGGQIAGFLGPVAALGAIGSAGGMISAAKSAAEFGKQLGAASVKTGVAVDQLAKYHNIAETMNIDTGTMDKGFVKLNRTLGDAAAGKNKNAAAMFKKLKIDVGGAGKAVATASDVFPKLADAIMRNENPATRTRLAMTAFGKSGADLLPILTQGSAKIREMSAEYERYVGKVTPQMLKSMEEGDEAFDKAELAAKGLKLSIGSALMPTIVNLIKPLTEWVVANRQLIANNLSAWASRVGAALKNVDWEKVAHSVMRFASAIGSVVKFLGPMGTMIAGVSLVMLPMVASALKAVKAIALLSKEFLVFGYRIARLAIGAVVGAIGNFVTAIRAGYSVMAAFNMVLAANPIGALIVGVMALAGAAFLIYKYWTPIKTFFKGLWSGIVSIFTSAWNKIKPVVDKMLKIGKFLVEYSPIGLAMKAVKGGAAALGGPTQKNANIMRQPLTGGVGTAGKSGSAGANGANGTVNVKVDLTGAQPGTKVSTNKQGNVGLNTGVRFAM